MARALFRINQKAGASPPGSVHWNGDEHVGSFAFIRTVGDEVGERFWQTAWQAFDGSPESFSEFSLDPSSTESAAALARELNRFTPTTSDRRRTPDILVIVGANRLGSPDMRFPKGPFSRLHLSNVVKRIAGLLEPTPIEAVRRQIGRTRIVLVHEPFESPKRKPIQPDSGDAGTVRALSIFRNGFTMEMARRLLAIDDAESQKLFDKLSFGAAAQRAIEHATNVGQCILRVGFDAAHIPPQERADLHRRAADAIVGYLGFNKDTRHLNYREALTPEWLHEAQWHLRQAASVQTERREDDIRAFDSISRAGEAVTWTGIREALNRDDPDSLELLLSMQKKLSDLDYINSLHPYEYVLLGRLSHQAMRKDGGVSTSRYLERGMHWTKFFALADEALARGNVTARELSACRILVATTRACILMNEATDTTSLEQVRGHIAEALRSRGPLDAIEDSRWFEYLGDFYSKADARSALNAYYSGIVRSAVPSLHAIVKYFGACTEASTEPHRDVLSALRQVGKAELDRIRGSFSSGLWGLPHVQARWEQGLTAATSLRAEGD